MRTRSSRRSSARFVEVRTPELPQGGTREPGETVDDAGSQPRLPEVYAGTAVATALALLEARESEEI